MLIVFGGEFMIIAYETILENFQMNFCNASLVFIIARFSENGIYKRCIAEKTFVVSNAVVGSRGVDVVYQIKDVRVRC